MSSCLTLPFAPHASSTISAIILNHLRYTSISALSFSAFFGMYSGMLCHAERYFGTDSLASSVIAGGAMGGAIGACLPPRMSNALAIGSMTAFVSGATAAVVNARR